MRGGGDGSGDRDVWERGEIVQGKALSIDDGREIAVTDAGADGDDAGSGIEIDGAESGDGNLVLCAVGNAVEGVAGAESSEAAALSDDGLHLFNGGGLAQVAGGIGIVAGPVGSGRGLCLGVQHTRQHTAGEGCARGPEKFSLIHSRPSWS